MTVTATARCRSCGATVIWLTIQPGGRRMPVNAEPVAAGNVLVNFEHATGEVIGAGDLATIQDLIRDLPNEPLYLSHFVTCPHAKTWRRRK